MGNVIGGLFGGAPKVDTSAQDAALKRQEDLLNKQEAKADKRDTEAKRKTSATLQAVLNRAAGRRSLLAPGRGDDRSSTLGGSVAA